MDTGKEAQKYVWQGAIPLQIHLHDSEVTTLPPPPPALILAPRIGYLPLLVPQIKPFFSTALPPGVDTVWFDYKGLPLKWYIPTGVLFDLLCAGPEIPWNLTVHFRGYPGNILTPCDGEDSVKWSFINSLKEAAYIINGNCKNIMNMSQSDQVDLWRAVVNGRIPVRLYVWSVIEDFDDLEDAPYCDSWDKISYINRPVEFNGEGKCVTLLDAVKFLLPEFFGDDNSSMIDSTSKLVAGDEERIHSEESSSRSTEESGEILHEEQVDLSRPSENAEIKLLRIQGIEPKLEIPFAWVVFEAGGKIWISSGDEVEVAKNDFIEILKQVEGALGEKDYFGGESFGFVDIILIGLTSWFDAFEKFGGFKVEDYTPKLSAWIKKCMKRESVAKTIVEPEKIYQCVVMLRKMNGIE
ncbi:hypothetical protein RJ639_006890 [Escallonia herrerae]|uniref:GST C-terminal domain-containing protein n=1 Tax=Escallonia herrerae TaxID=1293975 RepID=A0AA88VTX5_9ASTE|nr:hypothetical protein RJ639_006890 [Escallonia herrerae]